MGIVDIYLSDRLEKYLKGSKDAQKINGNIECEDGKGVSNVTSADIHKFNKESAQGTASLEQRQTKLVRHDRLQEMMDCGILYDNNVPSHHL